MPVPPLLGRRIHISGSIHVNPTVASQEDVEAARNFLRELIVALIKDGATFVVPIDQEKPREADGLPICFDWLILQAIEENLRYVPRNVSASGEPLIVAVQHAKNVSQIPPEKQELWDKLNEQDGLVVIENAGHWSMNSKRLEIQALHGDILIALGGTEGVLHLANIYHGTGRPVIPLPFPINDEHSGARRLWDAALVSSETGRFFSVIEGESSHNLLNRLNFQPHKKVEERVQTTMSVLRNVRKPRAFAVRLLNPDHPEYKAVETYFDNVVKPVAEEFGYYLKTMEKGAAEESFINEEIFKSIHYSSLVVADTTGQRPNCFIELGYALALGYPVILCSRARGAEEGRVDRPFDISPLSSHEWDANDLPEVARQKFRDHWRKNIQRPRIVRAVPLVP